MLGSREGAEKLAGFGKRSHARQSQATKAKQAGGDLRWVFRRMKNMMRNSYILHMNTHAHTHTCMRTLTDARTLSLSLSHSLSRGNSSVVAQVPSGRRYPAQRLLLHQIWFASRSCRKLIPKDPRNYHDLRKFATAAARNVPM